MAEVTSADNTSYAQHQNKRLHKTLGRFDIIFMVISAVVGLATLGSVSVGGPETFTWLIFLIIVFLIPYSFIFAETGAAFIGEGGIYLWVRRAFGRPAAAVASAFTWITQPVWVGGSMAILNADAASQFLFSFGQHSLEGYIFKIAFIWLTVFAAVLSLAKAKWIPTFGTVCKIVFLLFFIITAVIYAVEHGSQHISLSSFQPSLTGFFTLVPLLIFAFLGFEGSSSASGEMKNPQRDVAFSILRSSALAGLLYIIPVFTILLVIPPQNIDGIHGLLNAVKTVFSVYGPASSTLLAVAVILFILANIGQGAAWMIMSDRMQAIAAADGSFFGGFFGRFHKTLGTPIRVNILSGIISTVFMLIAVQLTGSNAAIFNVVLGIAITTYLFSYLLIIPAVVKLRLKCPDQPRPYRVPGPNWVFVMLGIVTTTLVLFATWITIFPGSIQLLFGLPFDFSSLGVPYLQFEALTFGTIGFIAAIALIGYWRGRNLRRIQ